MHGSHIGSHIGFRGHLKVGDTFQILDFMMTRELVNVLYCFIYLTVVENMYVDNKI